MTRIEAKNNGFKVYDGAPHPLCGTTLKYVNGYGCVKCLTKRGLKNLYNKEKMKKYHTPEKTWKRVKKWRKRVIDYDKRFKDQKGKCAICGIKRENIKRDFANDHNHKTGKIRGLLCGNCNMGLGQFSDNIKTLQKAIKYLEKYR